ncbi:MAG: glycosyltransferase [Thermoanaerobaculia bacterium]
MKTHIFTVNVEEYFHVAVLSGVVLEKHWDRLEPRMEANLEFILDLLRRRQATATFFVYGRIAELDPDLVRRIVAEGHEVASRGYQPQHLDEVSRQQLLAEIDRAKEVLEAAGANEILGFRAPDWLGERHLWLLDELAARGYAYDASLNPAGWQRAGRTDLHTIHRHRGGPLWELPIATVGAAGLRLAISGGNYIRQFPHKLLKRVVAWKSRGESEPLVFYLHTWEVDPDEPELRGVPLLRRIRHYRRLGKPRWVFADYLSRYRFVGAADYLGLPHPGREPAVRPESLGVVPAAGAAAGVPVTLVVPLYNERKTLRYLQRTLLELRRRLGGRYRVRFLLVDDGSGDDTPVELERYFGDLDDCRIVRHDHNRGVAAAIFTGIREADTEWVCSIDCDCSYDPSVLEEMLPMLEHADMATASPYHPQGRVYNVPGWRLFLSKTLSRLYSAVLGQRLYTYTSCCRVYRRGAMLAHQPAHGGFLGIAEMLLSLHRTGGRIVEHPAVLESRLLGESKMKVGRTIVGHLGLLREAAVRRVRGAAS